MSSSEKSWLKNYNPNVPQEIDVNSYASVTEVLEESFTKYKDKTAFINMGKKLSYTEIDELSKKFASFLQNKAHLKKGDRIAIQMPNILQFPVALFGALRAGLTVVNTNPLYTTREMKHQFKDAGVKAIVILANFAYNLEEVISETEIETVVVTELGDLLDFPKSILINKALKHVKKMVPDFSLPGHIKFNTALKEGAKLEFQNVYTSHDDLAFLQYTGGTTGVAKGAMLTHKNIIANMLQIVAFMDYRLNDGNELVCTPLPLYHIFSLTVNCMAMMHFGASNLLITNPRDIPGFIKILQKNRVSIFAGLNTLFNSLMNHPGFTEIDFKSLKITVSGGMALQTAVANRWEELTGNRVSEGYGLTESSPVASCNNVDGSACIGSIGVPVPSTAIKIVDDQGNEVVDGESGELLIYGPQVMKGYWQRPDETENMITEDGWLKTGDVAIFNEEGYFQIVDRMKDMILVSGFNVFPNEIEDVLAQHAQVVEVAAIGVPDERSGEIVKVFIVPKDKTLTKDEIIAHCKDNLAGYKVPKLVEFREDLPKSNVGKVLRRELREPTVQA
ncbi:MAG: AMP-binding protein [Bdellovibrionaceae bacterium]|jgi:long-chain acyl-CoA synthetase|nr:AMP-binding protein [Pseudobdellovibrionaceae bacterium]